jgi:hypothetical protein
MSQPRGSDDGGHAHPDDGLPELPPLPPGWADIHIPDDAHELAAEAAIVRAELALDPDWPPRRPRRLASAGPLFALVAMVTVAVTSLLMIVHPVGRPAPRAAPLAASPEAPGTVGGLLPDIVLQDGRQRAIPARGIRPGLLLLVPEACRCAARTAGLVNASRASLVQVELIGATAPPQVPSGAPSRTRALLDPGGALADSIALPLFVAPGTTPGTPVAAVEPAVTAVLVRSDGIIARILRDPAPSAQLQNDLAGLTIR